ncbi:MAG: hypothetical protein ABII07_03225 [Patescibacteria group bacterium]|nr:hypothetical protein [Patescibacteria group bacterium]
MTTEELQQMPSELDESLLMPGGKSLGNLAQIESKSIYQALQRLFKNDNLRTIREKFGKAIELTADIKIEEEGAVESDMDFLIKKTGEAAYPTKEPRNWNEKVKKAEFGAAMQDTRSALAIAIQKIYAPDSEKQTSYETIAKAVINMASEICAQNELAKWQERRKLGELNDVKCIDKKNPGATMYITKAGYEKCKNRLNGLTTTVTPYANNIFGVTFAKGGWSQEGEQILFIQDAKEYDKPSKSRTNDIVLNESDIIRIESLGEKKHKMWQSPWHNTDGTEQ